jgi:predicted transcriptional regulator
MLLSKCYVKEVVGDYSEIMSQINEILGQTGYKGKFIAKKLGIPESTFYQKKRRKTFSLKEMQQIVELMDDFEDDEIEDEYFRNFNERDNEGTLPLDALRAFLPQSRTSDNLYYDK